LLNGITGRGGKDEQFKPALARVVAAFALHQAKVPTLQFGAIQTRGIEPLRWAVGYVCVAPGSLHVLLATVLLDLFARPEN
jgi:hypothetical protein